MKNFYLAFSIMSLFFVLTLDSAMAKNKIDLLEHSALPSALADQSIIMATALLNNKVIAVGERGHILAWRNGDSWRQHHVPVSVAITAISILSDGSKVAVGHDGVILKSAANNENWSVVFTGHKLTQQKIYLLVQQKTALEQVISNTTDEDEKEELNYQFEDLLFAIEDARNEQQVGPSQPLLSISRTSKDILFVTGAYGTLLTSSDKGQTWQLISDRLDNPDNFHLNAIISNSQDQLYLVGENGLGFYSTNLGQNWSAMYMPYSGSLFGIIAIPNKNQLVAYGLQGNLMVSLDGGKQWQHKKLTTSASLLGGTIKGDNQVILVGHGGLIIDFDINRINDITIHKHPSGAAFSSVIAKEKNLILAGQFGIHFWQIK